MLQDAAYVEELQDEIERLRTVLRELVEEVDDFNNVKSLWPASHATLTRARQLIEPLALTSTMGTKE